MDRLVEPWSSKNLCSGSTSTGFTAAGAVRAALLRFRARRTAVRVGRLRLFKHGADELLKLRPAMAERNNRREFWKPRRPGGWGQAASSSSPPRISGRHGKTKTCVRWAGENVDGTNDPRRRPRASVPRGEQAATSAARPALRLPRMNAELSALAISAAGFRQDAGGRVGARSGVRDPDTVSEAFGR